VSAQVPSTIRIAEVLTALALASDVGHGQPLEKSLRTTVIATRLAEEMGLARAELSAVYYVVLLRSIGCTANSHETAILMGGDDRAFLGLVQALAGGNGRQWAREAAGLVAASAPELAAARSEAWFLTEGRAHGRRARDSACEVSTALARRLGLAAAVQTGLEQVYERWDGRGPGEIGGEALCVPARVAHLADVVEIALRAGGAEAACAIAHARAGSHFDPEIVAVFTRCCDDVLAQLDDLDMLDAALDAEPTPQSRCDRAQLEGLARAIADFADLKSPWTLGHSPAVAELAAGAVASEDREATMFAGLLHDIGRAAVSNGIWDKPGALASAQWDQVRLYPYYTERILARTPAFARIATLASAHRECLDGSGYHRAVSEDALSEPMRVLGAADAYVAMRADRAHRPALSADETERQLLRAVADGRLCERAVAAVLAAAGHAPAPAPAPVCGLTEREVQVLGLLARGLMNKQIAAELVVSARTVQHHVAHIYDKIDRRTRAGAAMFAMEHRLVGPPGPLVRPAAPVARGEVLSAK
jgi:HD-GYP domain-containing protein (c-di-GMP phosphodiesterase class II)/DNA-binding CsgD family transcriptional regulator